MKTRVDIVGEVRTGSTSDRGSASITATWADGKTETLIALLDTAGRGIVVDKSDFLKVAKTLQASG